MSRSEHPYQPPPKWLDQLLEQFCAPHLLEEVLGDLHERYYLRVQKEGKTKAQRGYWRDALSYIRLSIFKRQSYNNSKSIFMLSHYFQSAYRSLTKKQRGTTVINVVGLAVGVTASLFIALYIFHELSYDRYHTKADRIYRVETQKISAEGTHTYPGAPLGVATVLKNEFAEVEQVATIMFQHQQLIGVPNEEGDLARFKESVAFADHEFFELFDYEWVAGNQRTALSEPNTVVLTKNFACKYFGTTVGDNLAEALNKVIQLNNEYSLKVTGILDNYPNTTSFPYDIIISSSTLKDLDRTSWGGWSDNTQTYIVLSEGSTPQQLQTRFPEMIEKYNGGGTSEKRGHRLLPLLKVHSSDNSTLYALGFIGLFLLLIACINFVNLAIAQATKRAKEMGIRKVLGSSRGQLIRQIMGETFLVTLVAFLIAIASAVLLLPFASRLIKVDISVSSLLQPVFLSFTISLLFVVSVLSGWYPAWILSRFRPITALQNKVNLRRKNTFTLRQGMVILQFAVAQILIIGTIVVASQMHLFQSTDLGFTSEAIITVPLPNQRAETLQTLRNRLLQLTSVREASFSFNSPSAESNFMGELIYRTNDGETSIRTQFKLADTHFIDIYGIHLLAGKALQAGDTTGQVIVNEVFTQRMGLAQPEEAVGQYIDAGNQELIIQGVAQDFHDNSLHQNIDPTIIKLSPQHYYQAGIKIQTAGTQLGIQQGLQNIEEVWASAFPEQLFSYQFLDETLAQAYERETQTMRLLNVFAVIAILISCLGLYGLVSFMAVQRTKEVGIRKVLGASVNHILKLFSQEFIVLVAIAFIVAAPIGYYAMNQWLQDFAYKTSINWWMYGIAGGLVLFIALLTVNIQAIKAALANPVDSLRNE